ncbi:ATP-binding protein [Streptomyces sp. NPDC020681]|uniref:ATP-binding protein n=1 Tax=Streptomyces sp. NPDC020681 TaxID=3365083 RepID=UPI00378B5D0D
MTPALIGRDHPAGVLRAEIGRATDSHGGLLLVTGEAGIGKTSLVTDAADEARRRGALVLGGSCWDSESAPGYWPWVQVVRGLRRGVSQDEWAEAEKAAGGRLAVLLGEASGGASGEDDKEPFAVYDAVTTALVTVSQSRPVMVVLDDLHWSDPASLKLLEFAAQHAWFERLLLVGTYRDAEVETPDHPLQPLILPLAARATTTLTLTGLKRDEVGSLMTLTTGREPAAALVDEVHRRTGGNPFFVEQTARLWHGGSPVTAVAPGVREAVRRRLTLLPEPVGELLNSAAVLGREFRRGVLAVVAGAPVPHVDRLLDRAVAARLVTVREGGRFAFAHDLVRETLYDSLDDADARRRHGTVVRALDGAPDIADQVIPADLARHAYLAGDELPAERRTELLLTAARDASSRLATEEAVGHYRRALEVAEEGARGGGEDEPLQRRAALIALDLAGELHHYGAAESESWPVFDHAAALADEVGEPELLARVAITLHVHGSLADERRRKQTAARLREAYRALVGGTADAEEFSPERIAQELAVRYTAHARRLEDDEALAFALWARHDSIWGLGTAQERMDLTSEMAAVARRTANRDMEFHATAMRWVTMLELADPRYLDQLRTSQAVAERLKVRRLELGKAVDKCLVDALTGRFDEAEEHLAGVSVLGHEHSPFAFMSLHIEWSLRLLQGRVGEADAILAQLEETAHPYPGLLEGVTAAERGDRATALRLLSELDAAPDPLPRVFAPLGMRLRAQAAALSGDEDLIAAAWAELDPYRGQWVVSLYGCDISGPVDLWLGLLDAARGRWTEAIDELTAAIASADLLRARPWAVRAKSALAGALRARATAGDVARAGALAAEATQEAESLGLRPAGTPPPHDAPVRDEFRRDGAVWVLTYRDRPVHVPDAKGLRDLAVLLARPGTEVPAVRLLAPEAGQAFGGDPVLDEEAKSQYRRRLERLDEEIDRAAELGDTRRADEFDRERSALLDELRTAAGLGGRTRRLGDEAERARKTVTARIRDTLRRLDALHPELAAHLRESVTTGSYCSYHPPRPVDWRL